MHLSPVALMLLLAGLPSPELHSTVPAQDHTAPRALRHSDVVFMYDNPDMYEPYGCTVLGWAGGRNKQRIQLAHSKGVRLFTTSVGFLTEFRGMIDFSPNLMDAAARDFSGQPFIVPWLWDHHHKGQNAWWWCTNSPLYRKYLESLLEKRMPIGPDGLHIDDYRGSSGSVTWKSGCFCKYCLAGFRKYLADHVSKERLAELGITDLDQFDYRRFLVDRGVTVQDYNQRRNRLPLADEFYDFHVKANTAYIGEYRKLAERLRGKSLTLCVNSGLSNPQALAIAPQLSYFCCEVPHGASSPGLATHPIYIYKLGDGLQRPIASTASGQDWAYINEQSKSCLVRTWIALSYAFGQTLMAPHRQWCYTKEKGTHWYTGPVDEYAYVYRFVRARAALLDGYEAVAPVAVVYDNAANRKNRGKIEPICIDLAQRNVPFTVLIAGDDWLDYHLNRRQLADYRAVIVASSDQWLDAPQKKLLDEVQRQNRLVKWPDRGRLEELVPQRIEVQGAEQVMVVPRAIPGDPSAPVVLHLLNRNYDRDNDRMIPQKEVVIRIRSDLFPNRVFSRVVLHAAKQESMAYSVKRDDSYWEFVVPKLGLWTLAELQK